MKSKKRILVAPLNWGLGHATRCIPIIDALIKANFEPVIASDGDALKILKIEYPELLSLELPSYKISYSKSASTFKLMLLLNTPSILKAIKNEKDLTESIINDYNISGIISDNRFGVVSPKIPSVFITHQLNVLSGSTTWISTKIHQKFIKKFDECWVPDTKDTPNLSGKLGHTDNLGLQLKYIGPLSRFRKQDLDIKYDLLVLLSGPEPQRTFLEKKLLIELKAFNGHILFVKGKIEDEHTSKIKGNMTIFNFMSSDALETAINESALVLSRSGYTTIMDLAALEKKAFFIPTPGQYEQDYLAKRLNDLNLVPYCRQNDFSLKELKKAASFFGFKSIGKQTDFGSLFNLF